MKVAWAHWSRSSAPKRFRSLLRTEPEDAGILTLFFLPVWFLIVVASLLIGRRLGLLMIGRTRVV